MYILALADTPIPLDQLNETLQTWRDIPVVLALLLVLALVVFAAIVWRIRDKKPDADIKQIELSGNMISTLSRLIDNLEKDLDEKDRARQEESRRFTDSLLPIGDALNRLADLEAESRKLQKLSSEQNIKRDLLLSDIQNGINKVVADTPLLPHLEEIKAAIAKLQAAVECRQMVPPEITAQLTAIQQFIITELTELKAKQDAAARITSTMDKLPEDLP